MFFLLISSIPPLPEAIVFFLFLSIIQWLGHRYGVYRLRRYPDEEKIGLGVAENSLIGLTALLLAFSFSMTASKFETRREMIVDEAVAIRTAILQVDFFPDSTRTLLSNDFERYVSSRIAYYEAGEDPEKIGAAMNDAKMISNQIWKDALASFQNEKSYFSFYMAVPALNAMNGYLFKRDASRIFVVPRIVLWVLALMLLLSGFLAGYGARGRKWNMVLILSFSLMTSLAFYLVLELDRPRQGYINMLDAQQQIQDLRSYSR